MDPVTQEQQWAAREAEIISKTREALREELRREMELELAMRLQEERDRKEDTQEEDQDMEEDHVSRDQIGAILTSQNQLLTLMVEKQSHGPSELKVEGINMPQYKGLNLDAFMWNAKVFFATKNLDWQTPANQKRCMAMIVASLRGVAGSWYQDYVTRTNQPPHDLDELEMLLRAESVPPDLQERLRDALSTLNQKSCSSLEEYISRYREIMVQVREMSELDKVTWFNRGLRSKTKVEVNYRRCNYLSQAMSVALEYERTHFQGGEDRDRERPQHATHKTNYVQQRPNMQRQQQSQPSQSHISMTWRRSIDSVTTVIRRRTMLAHAWNQSVEHLKDPSILEANVKLHLDANVELDPKEEAYPRGI
ncbi:hypothetical protein AC1031_000068 [Aphanomyces cochlioides]|nr:hypothetical protein AC1031_000068 [Aphanomyces cochlioides]